jgi:hypothetical protein
MNKSSSVFTALESSLSEIDNILGKKVSIFEALESAIETGIQNLGLVEKNTFTFAAFESFIDEAISNLDVAEESSILDTLLQTAKSTIETKCKTVEDCDNMLNVITTEAVKFNSCMESMAGAGKELKSGSISKEEFKEKIAPAINELKTNCESLGIATEGLMDKFKKKPSEEETKMIEKVGKMSDMQLLKAYVPILKSEKSLVNDKALLEEAIEDDKDESGNNEYSPKIVTIDGTLFLLYHKGEKLDSVFYSVRGKHLLRITSMEKMRKAIISNMKKESKTPAKESSVTISDEHISTMREFIIGTRNLINEKKLSFGGEVDASLEGFINSCESMTIAEEGVNLQTAKMIRGKDVKEARNLVKAARKLAKSRSKESLEKAIAMLKDARALVDKAKKEIDSMPEPMTTWEKLKAAFTPIFTMLPSSEVKQVIPTYNYGGNGGMSLTVISETTEDELSESTASQLKKTLQQILNLLLKNIDKDISSYEKELTRVSSKANESVDTLDSFLFELALESYTEDDEDECCDDEDMDESSYDCYLR